MNCSVHKNTSAVFDCKHCGAPYCEQCQQLRYCPHCGVPFRYNGILPHQSPYPPGKREMPPWLKGLIGCLTIVGAIALLLLSTCFVMIWSNG